MRSILLSAVLALSLLTPHVQAEWKEVSNFKQTAYEQYYLQCDLRLKHLVTLDLETVPPTVETNLYFLNKKQSYSYNSATFTHLDFSMPTGEFLNMLTTGEVKAIQPDYAEAIITELRGGVPHGSGIRASFATSEVPELLATYSLVYPNASGSSAAYALNKDVFRLEADCSGTKFPGDANHDMCVDSKDVFIWYSNYLARTATATNMYGATFEQGDFDGNGILNTSDIGIIGSNYLKGCNIFASVGPSI